MSEPVFLSNGQISIGEAEGIAPEKTKYPMRVTLLSGLPGYHSDIGHKHSKKFIIETSSATHNDTLISTYNHNPEEIIGIGQNIRIDGSTLVCDGFIMPFRPNDRAEEIVYHAKNGIPFEASIEFTPASSDCEVVDEGGSVVVNGQETAGPVNVYRNVQVRAFSLCPLGSVPGTQAEFLSHSRKMEKAMAKETVKLADDGAAKETESKSQYPDLDELQKMFGDELGVRLFKDGVTLDEAKKVFEFNEKYGIVPKPEPAAETELNEAPAAGNVPGKKEEPKEDVAGLKAEIAKLAASNVKMSGDLAKLSAALTVKSEQDGIGQSFDKGKPAKSQSFAEITAARLASLRK
ncbi:hypothetical protein FACS18942_05100 [Planctomycetales bacterium]|nr:hypothetical protein FACS18942_05100 [Planctomycetales bacterium]